MVQPASLVGQVVDDRWLLTDHLGSGRYGDVFSANPRHLELSAGAVKVMRPQSEHHREQILREIQSLADLSNDNLLTYRDSGQIHGGVLAGAIYVVTELCDGTLADERGWASRDAAFDAQLTLAVTQVAAGLRYLHDRGYIHRDVKPANILRSGDRWKLSDFGLIRDLSSASPSVGVLGTAPYLAPETVSPNGAGTPADIFALGVVVHEALTGTWPYHPASGPWTGPPSREGASISISLELPKRWLPLVELCLDIEASHRPTASEISPLVPEPLSDLESTSHPRAPSNAQSMDTLPPPRRDPPRWKVGAIVAILAMTAIVVGVVMWWGPSDDASSIAGADTTDASQAEPRGSGTDVKFDRREILISGDVTLDADVNAALVITGSDLVLDCHGHTVSGPGSSDVDTAGITIAPDAVGVTIMNCVVTGFGVGINVAGAHSIVVANVTRGNSSGFVISAFDQVIRDNEALSNTADGFTVHGLGKNIIEGNRSDGNEFGFVLESSTAGNQLIHNTATRNGEGFHVVAGTSGNTFEANIARDNLQGFADDSSGVEGAAGTANSYKQNVCTDNGIDAVPQQLC